MKRPYFQINLGAITNGIEDIRSMRNIVWYDDKWWWGETTNTTSQMTAYIYSAPDFTTTPTLENSQTFSAVGTPTSVTVDSICCRGYGDHIMLMVGWHSLGATNASYTSGFYTDNGGSSWTFHNQSYPMSGDNINNIHDVVWDGSKWRVYFTYYNAIGPAVSIKELPSGNTGIIHRSATYESVWAGYLSGSKYYLVIKTDADDLELWSSTSYTVETLEETLSFTEPSNFDATYQLFWEQGDTQFILDPYYFRMRSLNETTWTEYAALSPPSAILVLWDKNHLDEYIISFVRWDNAIWEITVKGVLKKIQALEPRDYKKIYLTNKNENLTGVVQFQDRNGNDYLNAWIETDLTPTVSELTSGHQNGLVLTATAANGEIYYEYTTDTDSIDDIWVLIPTANQFYLKYREDTTEAFSLSFLAGNITVTDDGGVSGTVATYTYGKWIHINFDWNKSGSLDVTIDNTLAHTGTVGAHDINRLYVIIATDATYCIIDSFGQGLNSYVSGSNKKIDAYVGYGSDIGEAWFSTGDGTLMQLSFKDYTSGTMKSLTVLEIYKAPQHTLIRRTKPFEDEWVDEYTDAEVLFYGGKVKDNDSDNRFTYFYFMKSWQDENKETKINGNLIQYTHKELLEYVLDNFSKYRKYGRGTNADVNAFTADQIDGTDSGWTNTDGTGCTSSYVAKQGFANDFLYNILKQLDNGAGVCLVDYEISGYLVYSGWFASDDVTDQIKIEFYESATRIGYIEINASKIRWYDGAAQDILDPAVDDTDYHWALAFSATADTVDVYINGVYISTETLENNITTEITKIRFTTDAATVGPTGYHSNLYVGNSLIDAMHTYSSISPLLTTKYNFPLKNDSIPNIYKLIAEETGYIVSERPDGMVYVDQYAPSGKTINMNESQGISFMGKLQNRNEKFSLITFYGGFINGKQIIAQGFGEPNFGEYEDWFPEIQGQDAGDIYYDADGNPKSHRLDALVAKAIADRNIVVKKTIMGKKGDGMYIPGTSLTYNNSFYKVSMETWNCWRKNTYNGISNDNRVEIADSLLSPTKSDPQDDPIDQVNANIGTNADNIVKVEQNVGQNAEDADAGKFGPAGFENRTDSTIAMTTSTFGITGEYFVYCNNIRYYKDGDSVDMSAFADGLWYFYYNATDGVFTYSQTPWIITAGHALIATVYKNGATYQLAEERHGISRDLNWHSWAHDTLGVRYQNDGGLAGVFDVADAEITSGEIHDEDIEISITGTDPYQFSVFYRDISLEWVWTAAQSAYYHDVSNIVQYDNAGTLTDVSNASHVAYWIFATNHLDDPQIISVMGQRQDATLANAKLNNTPQGLALGQLPSAEWLLIYRVILKRVGTAVTVEDTLDYRTSGVNTVGVSTLTDHGALSGLANDDHPAYYTQTIIDTFWAIGAANHRYKPMLFEGFSELNAGDVTNWYANAGATDFYYVLATDLPATLGTKKLYIDGFRFALADADLSDFIDAYYLPYMTDHVTIATITSATGLTLQTAQEYSYTFTAHDASSKKGRIWLLLHATSATKDQLDVSYVEIRYYYA